MYSDTVEETMHLDESDTESDNNSSDDSENEDDYNGASKTTVEEHVRKKLTEKYKARHGKQLFVRFPGRLPEDKEEFEKKAKALSPLIVAAHKPRQKHARFCLVDFSTQSDRDEAKKSIRAAIKKDEKYKGIVVLIPRTESEDFVNELVNKKLQSIESKRAKARLKWAAKNAKRTKEFTSMVVVHNLPSNVSMLELRKLFPNAVDIQLKPQTGKYKNKSSIASVTLPTSFEAKAVVRKQLSLGGTQLSIRFDMSEAKKNTHGNKNSEEKHKSHQLKSKKKHPNLKP